MNPLLVIIATLTVAAIVAAFVWLALLLVLQLAHLDGDE